MTSEHKAIFKSATVISVLTVASRLTGFLRDVLLARLFGTGAAAQAFFVAFRIPNALRDILGEGAGNAAFVPVFCEELAKKQKADFLKLVNSLMLFLLAVSGVLALLGIFFSSPLVRLIAPGFFQDKVKFILTVHLTRLLFPYLVLITMSAYLTSVANSLKSFAVPATSSIAFNIVLILGLLWIGLSAGAWGFGPVYRLCSIVLIAGIVQVAIQLPSLFKKGIDLKASGLYRDFLRQEPIRKIGRLMAPRLLGTSVYQLNVFVDTIFASLAFFVGEGAVAAVYYANRIVQFPLSVFGVAISNAALPTMATDSAAKDMEKFKGTLLFSLKSVFLCMVPVTAGLLVFCRPLVRVVFERGSFDAYSSAITSQAVFFYSLGLLSYVGTRFLSHAFYALQDTVTPVKTAATALFLNIALNTVFIFFLHLKISGLALASSISATVNFLMLYRAIKRRVGFRFGAAFGRLFLKSLVSAAGMAFVLLAILRGGFFGEPSWPQALGVVAAGAASYAVFLWVLKTDELKAFVLWLRKKR